MFIHEFCYSIECIIDIVQASLLKFLASCFDSGCDQDAHYHTHVIEVRLLQVTLQLGYGKTGTA